jgi:hypothetical protein
MQHRAQRLKYIRDVMPVALLMCIACFFALSGPRKVSPNFWADLVLIALFCTVALLFAALASVQLIDARGFVSFVIRTLASVLVAVVLFLTIFGAFRRFIENIPFCISAVVSLVYIQYRYFRIKKET